MRHRLGLRLAGGPPVVARHALWSVISSLDDQHPPPTPRLLELGLQAAQLAASLDLSALVRRARQPQRRYLETWPGEHYRLLAAMTRILRPSAAVEVGTYTGMGCLAMASSMPLGKVVTYDIVPWESFPDSLITPADLGGGLEQRLGDLSKSDYFERESETLKAAGLIFVDGPKDGSFERTFLDHLIPLLMGSGAVLMLDDIRLMNMVQLWRELPLPKLDITSFGHWSGTGLAIFD